MSEVRTTSSTGGQKGVKLARFDLIPAGPLKELAEHYGRGARKYANHQWRQGYEWSKSIGALGRHFNDFMAGKDYDVCSNDPNGCSLVDAGGNEFVPEQPDTCFNHTGSHHMAAVAWHAFLLLEFKDTHPDHDDRYAAPPLISEIPRLIVGDEWDGKPFDLKDPIWFIPSRTELEPTDPTPIREEDGWQNVGWIDETQPFGDRPRLTLQHDPAVEIWEDVQERVGDFFTEALGKLGEITMSDVAWRDPEPVTIKGLEEIVEDYNGRVAAPTMRELLDRIIPGKGARFAVHSSGQVLDLRNPMTDEEAELLEQGWTKLGESISGERYYASPEALRPFDEPMSLKPLMDSIDRSVKEIADLYDKNRFFTEALGKLGEITMSDVAWREPVENVIHISNADDFGPDLLSKRPPTRWERG